MGCFPIAVCISCILIQSMYVNVEKTIFHYDNDWASCHWLGCWQDGCDVDDDVDRMTVMLIKMLTGWFWWIFVFFITGFLEKNRDTFSPDLLGLIQTSSNKFLVNLFTSDINMVWFLLHLIYDGGCLNNSTSRDWIFCKNKSLGTSGRNPLKSSDSVIYHMHECDSIVWGHSQSVCLLHDFHNDQILQGSTERCSVNCREMFQSPLH